MNNFYLENFTSSAQDAFIEKFQQVFEIKDQLTPSSVENMTDGIAREVMQDAHSELFSAEKTDSPGRDIGTALYYISISYRANYFGYWLISLEGEKHTKLFSSLAGDNKMGYLMYQLYNAYKNNDSKTYVKTFLELDKLPNRNEVMAAVGAFLCFDKMYTKVKGE